MIRSLGVREKIIAVICVVVLFVLFNVEFVFKNIDSQENLLGKLIIEKRKVLDKERRYIQMERRLFAEHESQIANFRQQGSLEQNMSALLSRIQQLAEENGLEVSAIKPKNVMKAESLYSLSIDLAINGGLQNIVRFLYVAQSANYSFGVESLTLEPQGTNSQKMNCRVNLSRILIPR